MTERVRLGIAIRNGPFYAPIVLAKQLTTLDHVCDGRLDVGLGLGWSPEEFAAAGVSRQRRGPRATRSGSLRPRPRRPRRPGATRSARRALVAVLHKIVIAIWHVLYDHTTYHDLGADYFTRRDPQRAIRRMTKEANGLGLTIRFDPIGA